MAYQTIWYKSRIPKQLIELAEGDLRSYFEDEFESSLVSKGSELNKVRKSTNAWVPSPHWFTPMAWFYVDKANRENFRYDIDHFDCEALQLTRYQEGDFYNWHIDQGLDSFVVPPLAVSSGSSSTGGGRDMTDLNSEVVRKLSLIVQLSDPDDYQGGNIQFMTDSGKLYVAPREQGSVIVFDSRTRHRVCKVTGGERRSLVGWVVGPRWK